MQRVKAPALYKKYFIDKADERGGLFSLIDSSYHPAKGIYPGCFVHITPSFFIAKMTYIDSDKRITKFFTDDNLVNYINENKKYEEKTEIAWFQSDYTNELGIESYSYDIMFSFYAGFISQSCKKYLKNDGILVCNNSHGDASIAYTDPDYILVGVIKRNGDHFKITDENLDTFFRKKDGSAIDSAKVLNKMIGENFTKKGYAYIFVCQRNISKLKADF